MKKITTEEFIEKAKLIHGYKYDYSLVEYVNAKTNVKIICPTHGVFPQTPDAHLSGGNCQKCVGRYRPTSEEFIEKAKKVHGDKYDYSLVEYVNLSTDVIIICKTHDKFEQNPNNHLQGKGCRKCAGHNKTTNDIINEFKVVHGDKYDYSLVEYVNSKTDVKIICPIHKEFSQTPKVHLRGSGCSKCAGVGKSTTDEFVKRAKLVHGDKYDYSLVKYVNLSTDVIIICKTHDKFEQNPNSHLRGSGCPKCRGYYKTTDEIVNEFKTIHGDKYDYSLVEYVNSSTKVKIICKTHGGFLQTPSDHLNSKGCQICAGNGKSTTEEFIKKSKFLHGDKYDYSNVNYVDCRTKVKIICQIHGEFYQTPKRHLKGSGCRICNYGWWPFNSKLSLINKIGNSDLLNMDQIELYIIQQQGCLPNEFKEFQYSESNSDERQKTLKELKKKFENDIEIESVNIDDVSVQLTDLDVEKNIIDSEITDISKNNRSTSENLPILNIIDELHSLDNDLYSAINDEDAIESLVQYKLRKIWNNVLNDESIIAQFRTDLSGGKYFNEIKTLFFNEYDLIKDYKPVGNYKFKYQPNLMQKLTVNRLLTNKTYGNWSGTGAGKTLSFIIASREIDSRLTVILALNSNVKQIGDVILDVYPDSEIFVDLDDYSQKFDRSKYNYLILNYEKLQQNYSDEMIRLLINNNQIDFVVIDEVHNVKQRVESNESIRRTNLNIMLCSIRDSNPNLYILAMSATPVINNLFEAISLLNLITGKEYDDLNCRKTVSNAINVFLQLLLNGIRYIPKTKIELLELTGQNMTNLNIDGSHLLDSIIKTTSDYTDLEKILISEKLKHIDMYLAKGVIIYSYYTTDIIHKIVEYVKLKGYSVATYTGEESAEYRFEILEKFRSGGIDILIGSKPIGTGVDGLQDICRRLIILTLPWTDAEYKQLIGRIYRQGSLFNSVEIIIPQIRIDLNDGEYWSWDIQRMNLIKNKKTLADTAVDGVIPSKNLPTLETLYKKTQYDLTNWQNRINNGEIIISNRADIEFDLFPDILNDDEKEERITSELNEFNRIGKISHSKKMNEKFNSDKESWFRYHKLRAARMEKWTEIPYEYIATKIKNKNHAIVDFGCGENKFKDCLTNKVIGIDHIAIDESVIATDMRNTNIESLSVDVTVFSLSLWGSNFEEYISEAYRILNYDGFIYIAEPSKNYETNCDIEKLKNILTSKNFTIIGDVENRGKFIYITGIKR